MRKSPRRLPRDQVDVTSERGRRKSTGSVCSAIYKEGGDEFCWRRGLNTSGGLCSVLTYSRGLYACLGQLVFSSFTKELLFFSRSHFFLNFVLLAQEFWVKLVIFIFWRLHKTFYIQRQIQSRGRGWNCYFTPNHQLYLYLYLYLYHSK